MTNGPLVVSLAVALGVGLLVGLERERRKGEGDFRSAAGLRTFALAALTGTLAFHLGGVWLLTVALVGTFGLVALSYRETREADPGLTTEVALPLTLLIGGLALIDPATAAGLGVVVAILLAGRTSMHHFARSVLSEQEMRSGLTLAAATLIVLPLLPDRYIGPLEALNPRSIWLLAILVMAISAAGHVAVRALGARLGLPLAGFLSGFASSLATIGSMGARAAASPGQLGPAVAGAVLSSVATFVQLALLVGSLSPATLWAAAGPLTAAGGAAVACGLVLGLGGAPAPAAGGAAAGKVLDPFAAVALAGLLAAVLLLTAGLQAWAGPRGTVVAAGLAGLVDAHAAAISVTALVAGGKLAPAGAVVPILVGVSTNTLAKIVAAAAAGSRPFAVRVVPGLLLVLLALWGGAWLGGGLAPGP